MQDSYFNLETGASVYLMPLGQHEGQDLWLITSVGVMAAKRGQGAASELLDQVIAHADKEKVALALNIEPDGTGLDFQQLQAFYQRRGFVDAEHFGPVAMFRQCASTAANTRS